MVGYFSATIQILFRLSLISPLGTVFQQHFISHWLITGLIHHSRQKVPSLSADDVLILSATSKLLTLMHVMQWPHVLALHNA